MGQFARLLPECGWDVTVLTARHGNGTDRAALAALDGKAKIIDAWSPASAVSVRGKPTPRQGLRGKARRWLRTATMSVVFPDREVFWVPGAIARGRAELRETRHDLVLATHGPASDLIVGRALAKQFRIPLVVDFRDLWSTLTIPFFPTPAHRAAARVLERSIVRDASRIVAVSPPMAADLASAHGVEAERAVAITNGFDPEDIERVRDSRDGDRPFRLMYVGSVHAHYNLDGFWRVIKALADEGRITPKSFRIEFIGNVSLNDVKHHGVEGFVEAKPFVPHEQVFDNLARADALLVVETPGYYARYGYAAKVFDYVLTGKPVLALVEGGGNTARLLDQAGVGYLANPTNEAEMRRSVEAVLALKGVTPATADAERPPLRDFNRRYLVEKLARVFDDVVTTEPRGRW